MLGGILNGGPDCSFTSKVEVSRSGWWSLLCEARTVKIEFNYWFVYMLVLNCMSCLDATRCSLPEENSKIPVWKTEMFVAYVTLEIWTVFWNLSFEYPCKTLSIRPVCRFKCRHIWWWSVGVFFLEAVFFRNFESFWVVALAISGPKPPFSLNLKKPLTNEDCLHCLFGVAFIKRCKTFPKVLDWKHVYRINLFKFLEHQPFHTKNLTRSVLVFEQRCWTVTELTASKDG